MWFLTDPTVLAIHALESRPAHFSSQPWASWCPHSQYYTFSSSFWVRKLYLALHLSRTQSLRGHSVVVRRPRSVQWPRTFPLGRTLLRDTNTKTSPRYLQLRQFLTHAVISNKATLVETAWQSLVLWMFITGRSLVPIHYV